MLTFVGRRIWIGAVDCMLLARGRARRSYHHDGAGSQTGLTVVRAFADTDKARPTWRGLADAWASAWVRELHMILSTNSDLGEFDTIRVPDHVEQVWAAIESALPKYWQAFIDREAAKHPATKLANHFGGQQGKTSSTGSLITQAFATAVQQYEKAAETYRTFFDPEAMEEFADDPNTFKNHLAKEVPVIAGTLNQRRSELQKWQRDFRMARGKDLPGGLLQRPRLPRGLGKSAA